jgi:hypothetical protein
MEDVEIFLSPLTARSKVREVIRGLVATRQVHSMSVGHAPHFYVAGTLPEFTPPQTMYASSFMPASIYFHHSYEREEEREARPQPVQQAAPPVKPEPIAEPVEKLAPVAKPVERPRFSRPAVHARDRKPAQASSGRVARRASSEARGPRHAKHAAKHTTASSSLRSHSNGTSSSRNGHSPAKTNGHKAVASTRTTRTASKVKAKPSVAAHKRPRPVAASAKTGSSKRFGLSSQRTKKRG